MCGITGFINPRGQGARRADLVAMTETLSHRGPDEDGLWLHKNVGLGHRRLSIIDLSSGQQPMTYQDGRYVLTYNGEIYNFRLLKKELQEEGYSFQTDCDTEIILAAYHHWGVECLNHFNGMFSFALWDRKKRELFLGRDPLGQKPLYYSFQRGTFLFASELKALLKHPQISGNLDYLGLARYLLFESLPNPDSILEGIEKLPPGKYLIFREGQTLPPQPQTYWECQYYPQKKFTGGMQEAQSRFFELFDQAVQRCLVSDVPLGIFLSGGVDSSSIVALAARHLSGKDLKTFSIAFREESFDESEYIQEVADLFQTEHYMEVLEPGRLLDLLPTVIRGLDEPLADPSIIPTYLLSKFTSGHVKVALGGDGGDELWAGYDPFLAIEPANLWRHVPRWLHRLALQGARYLPTSDKNISLDFKIKRFLRGAWAPPQLRYPLWLGAFTPGELTGLLKGDIFHQIKGKELLKPATEVLEKLPYHQRRGVTGGLAYFSKIYLPEDILVKVDRASMLNSLEVRAPFLDVELVDFVNSLPPHLKLRCSYQRKYLFKKVAEKMLPERITSRPKKGFGIPLSAWLKKDLKPLMEEYLNPDRLEREGLFSPSMVATYIEDHIKGRANHAKPLWTLLIFQLWQEQWL